MTDEEIIAVVTAHKEGKTIEVSSKSKLSWEITQSPCWNFDFWDYRIKPEPHYRPFENAEEVMKAIKEHGDWVRYDTYFDRIVGLANRSVNTVAANMDYCTALNKYRFLDDTPFGKLVEE